MGKRGGAVFFWKTILIIAILILMIYLFYRFVMGGIGSFG